MIQFQRIATAFAARTQRGTARRAAAFAAFMLMLGLGAAWATDYVIVYNNANFLAQSGGTVSAPTAFNPATCLWTAYNGTTVSSLSGTASRSLKNGSYYLGGSTTAGAAMTASTSATNAWRTSGGRLAYYSGSTNYYAYYRGSSWRTSSTERGNNNNAYQSNNGKNDYRGNVYEVTTGSASAVDNTTAPPSR